jgi:hypothetical protein
MLSPFLQDWDGTNLSFRLLVSPQTDPNAPPALGETPFSRTAFDFTVRMIADPAILPTPASATAAEVDVSKPAPTDAEKLFKTLQVEFQVDSTIGPKDPRDANIRVMKYAPPAYRDATGYAQGRNPFLLTDDTYHCALKAVPPAGTDVSSVEPKISWGAIFASVLKQPLTAEMSGLVRPLKVAVPEDVRKQGGWIYVTLKAGSAWSGMMATPDAVRTYAARIPPLPSARPLFTPVLFPVTAAPVPGYDPIFAEATRYDDGFAKEVYGAQPPFANPFDEDDSQGAERPGLDRGMYLGWDDEQIVTWYNRQLDPAAAPLDAPMGVQGFHVDTREEGATDWTSLNLATTKVVLNTMDLGQAKEEFPIEIGPNKLVGDTGPNTWLPSFFTSWDGRPMVGEDQLTDLVMGGQVEDGPVMGIEPAVPLRYGKRYDWRVRLRDITGGGPKVGGTPRNPGAQPVFNAPMLRYVRPGGAKVDPMPPVKADPAEPPTKLTVTKPRLSYPACLIAGGAAADIKADVAVAIAERRPPGLPDPDADLLEIVVDVMRPDTDPENGEPAYEHLYTLERKFDAKGELSLTFSWKDVADIQSISAPASGAVVLPTSRAIRLSLTPLCSDKPDYFGGDDVRRGQTLTIPLRKWAAKEAKLMDLPRGWLAEGLYLQPVEAYSPAGAEGRHASGEGGFAAQQPVARLAAAMNLGHTETMLRALPGTRVMFGTHASLNAVVGPDGASIRFATQSEVCGRWLVPVVVSIERDWTWDGLKALRIERDGQVVGRVDWRQSAGHEVGYAATPGDTDLIFFDVVDQQPAAGDHPRPGSYTYRAIPEFHSDPNPVPQPLSANLELPVSIPPQQVPKIVSAGIALSAFERSADYSDTSERKRMVWLEFDQPPGDPNDRYFARMLASSPDPVLTGDLSGDPSLGTPPIPIDPEPLRRIVPGQGDDKSGLAAMQELLPTDSPLHFLLPLPPGMTPNAPEMFGFFQYEFRVGHAKMWSTAQGRFGRPLHVAGIQHAPPGLDCGVDRSTQRLTVSASFADPVHQGQSVQPTPPRTELWAMLYVQTVQADASDRRNLLLGHRRLELDASGGRETALTYYYTPQGAQRSAGRASWSSSEITSMLDGVTLGPDAPLSCIVVETLPGKQPVADPLGEGLGYERILRVSPLTRVPEIC